MAVFELTAKHYMDMGQGNVFQKGDVVRIDVFRNNISAGNLMINPESRRTVIDQMASKGLDRIQVTSHLHTGAWDVKELSSMTPLERMSCNYVTMPNNYLNRPFR